MVIKPFLLLGLAADYRSWRWVWSTVVRRPSEVSDTYRRTKLTAPETISRSRDMVGAHQNLNALATINLSTQFEISNSTHYEDMKGDTKCVKWSDLGQLESLKVTGK